MVVLELVLHRLQVCFVQLILQGSHDRYEKRRLTHGLGDNFIVIMDDTAVHGFDEWPCGRFFLEVIEDELE